MQASSQTLLLDNFAAPSPAVDPAAPSQNWVASTPGIYANVAGQARDAYYWLYIPGAGTATASIGGGAVSVNSGGAGAYAELALGYGAYGNPLAGPPVQGPALGLNLSGYGDLQASFAHANNTLNLVAGFYTTNPLAGGNYYWTGEINLTPTVAGGPATGNLNFTGGGASTFNFSQVDGIVFIVDRAAQADGNVYGLSSLQFTQAVPEPASAGMLLAGVAMLGAWRQRRQASAGVGRG